MADFTISVKILGDSSSLASAIEGAKAKLGQMQQKLKDKVASTSIQELGTKLQSVGGKMEAVGKQYTTKVTAPIVAGATVSVKKFAEVDKTMQLTNATMGNSEKEAKILSDAMKSAASNSTFGMNDAAGATLNFARAGLDAQQAADALAPAMNLAAGEGGNLDTVSSGLVATINGFGDSFENATNYADVFANACNNSALDIDSLSNSMSIAAPIFSAAGYGVKDAALYMGVMANAGIDANVAANSLKTGMARLVEPSKEGAAWMEKLGISITNADGSMKDSAQVQKELHDAFSGLSDSEQIAAASAIFGKNQMSNWLALINTAPEDVAELSGALDEEGTTASMAESMMSGFGGSLEKLKSSIDVAATSFGEALAPMISKVADMIQRAVDWFNALSPAQQQTVAKIALLVAAIGPLLVIGGKLTAGLGNMLIYGPKIISAVGSIISIGGKLIAGIGKLILAMGPIGIAIAAAIAIGILLYKNWDTIKEKATELWNHLKEKFEAIKEAISDKVEAMKAVMSAAWNAIKSAASAAWNAIKTVITAPFIAAWNDIKFKAEAIKLLLSIAWSAIKSAASAAWNGIKNAIINPIQTARDKVKSIIDKVKGFFPIKVGNLLKGIKLPHFSISGKFSIMPPSVPKLKVNWYAKGGIFDTASVIGVGEKGPEAVTPIDKLKGYIVEAVTNAQNIMPDASTAIDSLADAIASGFAMQNAPSGGGEYHIVVELGGARVAETIYSLNRQGEIIMKGA